MSWHFIPKYFSLILPTTRTVTFLTSISLAPLRRSDLDYTIQHTVHAQMTFECPSERHFHPVKIYKLPLAVYKLQSLEVKHSPWLPSILCDPESFGDVGTISLQNIHVLEFVYLSLYHYLVLKFLVRMLKMMLYSFFWHQVPKCHIMSDH